MLPPSIDPSGRGRSEAGLGSTQKRKTALLASSSPACRRSKIGRPAAFALRFNLLLSDKPKDEGLPLISRIVAASAPLDAAASASHRASSSFRGAAWRKSSTRRPYCVSPIGYGSPASPLDTLSLIHKRAEASASFWITAARASTKPLPAPASRMLMVRISVMPSRGMPSSRAASTSGTPKKTLRGNVRLADPFPAHGCASTTRAGDLPSNFAIVSRRAKSLSCAAAYLAMASAPFRYVHFMF